MWMGVVCLFVFVQYFFFTFKTERGNYIKRLNCYLLKIEKINLLSTEDNTLLSKL